MKNILFLPIAMFAFGMDAYVVAGIIPEISTSFQITEAETAQMVTAFTLCYALSAPILATLLASFPTKKALVLSMLMFIAANLVTIFSTHLTMLLASRALAGIGAGIFSPLAAASAASLVPADKKGRALGLLLGGMSAGTVVGVPAGLALATWLGWQGVFAVVIGIAIIGLIGLVLGVPQICVAPPPSLKARVALLASRSVSMTITVTFLTAVASLGLYSYLAPVITGITQQTNLTPYLWVWGLGGMVGSFTIGHLIDWVKHPRAILLGILTLMSVAILSIPSSLALSSIIAFVPFFLWGAAGWSSLAPQQHTLISLQPEQSAAVVALNSSSNYLGGAVGTLLGGLWLGHGLSVTQLVYAAAAVGGVAIAIQIGILRHNTHSVIKECKSA
ncbi:MULTISPECIES: MFS transporter [unclassified Salinivibrio]|uniref:MFS transporter n=1 Tax=unclassified Salinivibrio TaxID=2636825 RepID=UPI00061474C6|nr:MULTISPECIES: MFS transporter [unclassified Salinivibrio]KKA44225.1 MFS transporter [Salinivibrio sp. KP-1]MPS31338.1 MFS transporter [Salinivibrio sp. VYel7]MPX92072.1 MFS transporter [Salinivibrio sp. VYel1]MPX92736.1 MFS transporter [Salinivibrio sp. VYel9]MPX95580.1 MFS transporter [Salinivibrio sp. VYel6]